MFVRDYYVELHWLPKSEGGGWHVTVPDLPGCMSDGDTVEQAMENVEDAIGCWIAAAERLGRDVPAPAVIHERRA